jgi:hypothetical protein
LSFSFKQFGYAIYDLPREAYPYSLGYAIPRVDTDVHDSTGVRMYKIGTTLYDHPVGQAQYGLNNLESYLFTGDTFYLQRAQAQAQRLMARARNFNGGWYISYPFNFDLHGIPSARVYAPWYSSMAQGQALSLFVRLYDVTGQSQYRTAADGVFTTFLLPRGKAAPWTVFVDASGYLWLEEYAGPVPDRTYNGHMFAAWGIWDYWRLTKDDRARRLWDGALSTAGIYAQAFRTPLWVSKYCLAHRVLSASYHAAVIGEFATLYTMSRNPGFALNVDNYEDDYPPFGVSGNVHFAAGTHSGVTFNSAGGVRSRRLLFLRSASWAPANQRIRVKGQPGFWYRITAGGLAGYYVQEKPSGTIVLMGRYLTHNWAPARTAAMASGGQYVGYRFNVAGAVTGSLTVKPTTATTFAASQTTYWNAIRYVLASSGPLDGYWVAVSAVGVT